MDAPLVVGGPTAYRVEVSPLVLFAIVSNHVRRESGQQRVIGTLLGRVNNNDMVVEVTNSFPVPHNETEEQVAVDMEFHQQMCALHTQTNSKEGIVGWYATGDNITYYSVLIHEFYSREASNAIHLTVDTALKGHEMGIRGFMTQPFGMTCEDAGNKQAPVIFSPLQTTVKHLDVDRIALELLQRGRDAPDGIVKMQTDVEAADSAAEDLLLMVNIILEYIRKLKNGTIPEDKELGRQLLAAVDAIPSLSDPSGALFNNNLQDILMVVYLSNLTRAQLSISKRLEKLVPGSGGNHGGRREPN